MRSSTSEWSSILESEIWQLPKTEDKIMSFLKLSFHNLKSPSLNNVLHIVQFSKRILKLNGMTWSSSGWLKDISFLLAP